MINPDISPSIKTYSETNSMAIWRERGRKIYTSQKKKEEQWYYIVVKTVLSLLNNIIDVCIIGSGRDYMMWKLKLETRRKDKAERQKFRRKPSGS
jgi:hypothetical protein